MGQNGNLDRFVAVIVIVAVFGIPHGVLLISGFVGLHRAEARIFLKYKNIM